MRKKLLEITRSEWISFVWVDDSAMGDDERYLKTESRRTPEEACQAAMDWDSTIIEREETKDIEL
jgi:hypothetical protein